jgi:hypothetical protein
MSRCSLALCALAIALIASNPARADFTLIRWASGDCKIWHDDIDNRRPLGSDWLVLASGLPTYDYAWQVLREETALGNCRW